MEKEEEEKKCNGVSGVGGCETEISVRREREGGRGGGQGEEGEIEGNDSIVVRLVVVKKNSK